MGTYSNAFVDFAAFLTLFWQCMRARDAWLDNCQLSTDVNIASAVGLMSRRAIDIYRYMTGDREMINYCIKKEFVSIANSNKTIIICIYRCATNASAILAGKIWNFKFLPYNCRFRCMRGATTRVRRNFSHRIAVVGAFPSDSTQNRNFCYLASRPSPRFFLPSLFSPRSIISVAPAIYTFSPSFLSSS